MWENTTYYSSVWVFWVRMSCWAGVLSRPCPACLPREHIHRPKIVLSSRYSQMRPTISCDGGCIVRNLQRELGEDTFGYICVYGPEYTARARAMVAALSKYAAWSPRWHFWVYSCVYGRPVAIAWLVRSFVAKRSLLSSLWCDGISPTSTPRSVCESRSCNHLWHVDSLCLTCFLPIASVAILVVNKSVESMI